MAKRKAKQSDKVEKTTPELEMEAISKLDYVDVISRRWEEKLPESGDYFYDEELPKKLTKSSKDFPPDEMDLSDAWTVAIVQSGITGEDRARRWPFVFTRKGLRANYVNKGQFSKQVDPKTKNYAYVILFGERNMYGSEGKLYNLPAKANTTETANVSSGLLAQVQDGEYDFDEAAQNATEARARLGKKSKRSTKDTKGSKKETSSKGTKKDTPTKGAKKVKEPPKKAQRVTRSSDVKSAKVKEEESDDEESEQEGSDEDEDEDQDEDQDEDEDEDEDEGDDEEQKEASPAPVVSTRKKRSTKEVVVPIVAAVAPKASAPVQTAKSTTKSVTTDGWAVSTKSKPASPLGTSGGILERLRQKRAAGSDEKLAEKLQTELKEARNNCINAEMENSRLKVALIDATKDRNQTRSSLVDLLHLFRVCHNLFEDLVDVVDQKEISHKDRQKLQSFTSRSDQLSQDMHRDLPTFAERIFGDSEEDFQEWKDRIQEVLKQEPDLTDVMASVNEDIETSAPTSQPIQNPQSTSLRTQPIQNPRATSQPISAPTSQPIQNPQATPIQTQSFTQSFQPGRLQTQPRGRIGGRSPAYSAYGAQTFPPQTFPPDLSPSPFAFVGEVPQSGTMFGPPDAPKVSSEAPDKAPTAEAPKANQGSKDYPGKDLTTQRSGMSTPEDLPLPDQLLREMESAVHMGARMDAADELS